MFKNFLRKNIAAIIFGAAIIAGGGIFAYLWWVKSKPDRLAGAASAWLVHDDFNKKPIPEKEIIPPLCYWHGPSYSNLMSRNVDSNPIPEGEEGKLTVDVFEYARECTKFLGDNAPSMANIQHAKDLVSRGNTLFKNIGEFEDDGSETAKRLKTRLRWWVRCWATPMESNHITGGLMNRFVLLSQCHTEMNGPLFEANAGFGKWNEQVKEIHSILKGFYASAVSQDGFSTWHYLERVKEINTDSGSVAWESPKEVSEATPAPIIAEAARRKAKEFTLKIGASKDALGVSRNMIEKELQRHKDSTTVPLYRVLKARQDYADELIRQMDSQSHDFGNLANNLKSLGDSAKAAESEEIQKMIVDWVNQRQGLEFSVNKYVTAKAVSEKISDIKKLSEAAPTPKLKTLLQKEADALDQWKTLPYFQNAASINEAKVMIGKAQSAPFPLLEPVLKNRLDLMNVIQGRGDKILNALKSSEESSGRESIYELAPYPEAASEESKALAELNKLEESFAKLRKAELAPLSSPEILNTQWKALADTAKGCIGAKEIENAAACYVAKYNNLIEFSKGPKNSFSRNIILKDLPCKSLSDVRYGVAVLQEVLKSFEAEDATSAKFAKTLEQIEQAKDWMKSLTPDHKERWINQRVSPAYLQLEKLVAGYGKLLTFASGKELDIVFKEKLSTELASSWGELQKSVNSYAEMQSKIIDAENSLLKADDSVKMESAWGKIFESVKLGVVNFPAEETSWKKEISNHRQALSQCISWGEKDWDNPVAIWSARELAKNECEKLGADSPIKKLWRDRAKALEQAYKLCKEEGILSQQWVGADSTKLDDYFKGSAELRCWFETHPDTRGLCKRLKEDMRKICVLKNYNPGYPKEVTEWVHFTDDKKINDELLGYGKKQLEAQEWHPWVNDYAKLIRKDFLSCDAQLRNLHDLYFPAHSVVQADAIKSIQMWIDENSNISWQNDGVKNLMAAHIARARYFTSKQSYRVEMVVNVDKKHYLWATRSDGKEAPRDGEWCFIIMNGARVAHVEIDGEKNFEWGGFSRDYARFYAQNNNGIEKFVSWKIGDPMHIGIVNESGDSYTINPKDNGARVLFPVEAKGTLWALKSIHENRYNADGLIKINQVAPSRFVWPNGEIWKTVEIHETRPAKIPVKSWLKELIGDAKKFDPWSSK